MNIQNGIKDFVLRVVQSWKNKMKIRRLKPSGYALGTLAATLSFGYAPGTPEPEFRFWSSTSKGRRRECISIDAGVSILYV
jgi:hypothetical protein